MSELKTYALQLTTRGSFTGTVQATSVDDAVARTFKTWCTVDPNPYEQVDDELMSVIAEEEEEP